MSNTIRRYKLFFNFGKEREWLEDMALKGWMLKDIKIGCVYDFQKEEPRRMLYEIDRFDLKRNPTLEDMLEKKAFVAMAQEAGWQEVTHDESMNYYFAKEYEEDGFNELYNDVESLQYRADKYRNRFMKAGILLIKLVLVVAIAGFLMGVTTYDMAGQKMKMADFVYQVIVMIYIIASTAMALVQFKMAEVWYKDMLELSRERTEKSKQEEPHRQWRLILTSQGLRKYLKKHSMKGEKLVSMGMLSYTFVHTEHPAVDFVLDTKSMVDERRQKAGEKKLKDTKDWNLMSNDWQAESIEYAQRNGMECLCAFDNRAIIYQVYEEEKIPEDMKKQRVRLFSILGGTGMLMLIGGCIGAVIGFISVWLK